jgi:predicted nucleic acid-binding protein
MFYLDTSVVVPVVVGERESMDVRRWVANNEGLFVSPWVHVEFASTLSRKVAGKELRPVQRAQAERAFEQVWREALMVCAVGSEHFELAREVCEADVGIRAADALHMAVAVERRLTLVTRGQQISSIHGLA